MRYLIRYLRRLGDIIGCLPACKHLRDQGHEVWFETDPQFADIFHCVDYVQWQNPYLHPAKPFDRVLDLQIHDGIRGGARYELFRQSKVHWRDFVYDHDDIRPAAWQRPVFTRIDWFDPDDYHLPKDRDYALIGATGISQQQKYTVDAVVSLARKLYGTCAMASLSASPNPIPGYVHARRLRELPGLIAHPRHCLLINSGPNVIAGGVRESYHLIPQVGVAAQDNMNYGNATEVAP